MGVRGLFWRALLEATLDAQKDPNVHVRVESAPRSDE